MKKLFLTTSILLLAAACNKQPVTPPGTQGGQAQVQPSQIQQAQPSQSTQTQSQTTPTDDTTNWKTYRNDQYGFELKYPSSAEFEENSKIAPITGSLDTFSIRTDKGYIYDVIAITVQNSKSSLSDAYKDSPFYKSNSGTFIKSTSNNINGMPASLSYFCSDSPGNSQECDNSLNGDKSNIILVTIMQHNGKDFIFKYYGNNKYVIQVISSFKFTN